MKKISKNIWISAAALWTVFAAAEQSAWLLSQSSLAGPIEYLAMIVSALGALGALAFSFTDKYRLIWIGFALAIFNPGEYGTFLPAVIGIILTLVKQNESKAPAQIPRTKVAAAMPAVSTIVGILLIVGPILLGTILSSMFCTDGWGPSCTYGLIPIYTVATAPIGIIFIVVGSLRRSRAVKPNAPIDSVEEHKGK
jgi:hypothetical protein